MTPRVHTHNPEEAVAAAFFRIQQTSMAGVPILNPALSVEAIDFQRWQGHWLGMVVTPWCMSLTLLPGHAQGWVSVGVNKRRFIKFPAGDFAFLGGQEDELGEYQSCSLFSPMNKFGNQFEAVQTARAALIGLLTEPAVKKDSTAEQVDKKPEKKVLSRRGFLAFRKS
ncbi:[NiFe]-hydrogenase assembly chaperone HybE [Rhodoferax sp.]|uniref:[NiFe]-hydrogenase assembly chaperone HybE n=1 Tax=Rhodoferax sp. TaxID=50421 RepID=UPI0019E3A0A4|nr:[NiFe]-hydrogenase assembly chaperone HybE [Rhodoferax sp.]MBE0472924.1 [NiFe]-hydrogenase assembly chaperone HybE [Rhodoferax sp.]